MYIIIEENNVSLHALLVQGVTAALLFSPSMLYWLAGMLSGTDLTLFDV